MRRTKEEAAQTRASIVEAGLACFDRHGIAGTTMADIAAANGIDMLLASIPPAGAVFWQPEARPLQWIPALNAWLSGFAAARGMHYVDYHAVLTDGHGALQDHFSADGVHVTRAAYHVMRQVLERCIGRSIADDGSRDAGFDEPLDP